MAPRPLSDRYLRSSVRCETECPHRARRYAPQPLGPDQQFASLSFDTHAEEIFPALTAGALLVVVGADGALPDELADGHGSGPTVLDLPTPYWHRLVDDIDALAWPEGLRLLILGADQVQQTALARRQARFGSRVRVVNSYGPTETTVIATAIALGPDDAAQRPPIGRPLSRATVTVRDAHGQLLPRGAAGVSRRRR
ncbi:AMP-binding protein [Streptomyces sp. NPDC005262]|uniref:AMP-binding protein n=1 Tax=Streptomyces sp. NPDC005262 TaxID=3364710 RepID=UPI0036C304A8